MVVPAPIVTSISSVFPARVDQDELWDGFFAHHLGDRRASRMAFRSVGVDHRHAVANPLEEDLSRWPTGARMDRYTNEAVPLGKEAISNALARSGLSADEVGCFIVVSCTGYSTPGVDIRLARDLGMAPDLTRVMIGHVGCHAAMPGLDVARRYVATEGRPAVVLCVELPSLHLQPPSGSLDDVVIHALFSDAASVAIVEPAGGDRSGLSLLDVVSHTAVGSESDMTWTVTDLGFKMTLSRRVPDVLADAVGPVVDRLLSRHGLARDDVAAWAVHPGGPRILNVVADRLELDHAALEPSRSVLAAHGNCSSATVLVVLEALGFGSAPVAGHIVALAFGPGLTVAAGLLRADAEDR